MKNLLTLGGTEHFSPGLYHESLSVSSCSLCVYKEGIAYRVSHFTGLVCQSRFLFRFFFVCFRDRRKQTTSVTQEIPRVIFSLVFNVILVQYFLSLIQLVLFDLNFNVLSTHLSFHISVYFLYIPAFVLT